MDDGGFSEAGRSGGGRSLWLTLFEGRADKIWMLDVGGEKRHQGCLSFGPVRTE